MPKKITEVKYAPAPYVDVRNVGNCDSSQNLQLDVEPVFMSYFGQICNTHAHKLRLPSFG